MTVKQLRQIIKEEVEKTKECKMYDCKSEEELDEDKEADREKMVKGIKAGIQSGKIPKTYVDKSGKRKETNPWAISNSHYGKKKK